MESDDAGHGTMTTESPLRRKTVAISIVAVAILGTPWSQAGIRDCEIQSQCFVVADHDSISSGLVASILDLDLGFVRGLTETQRFVNVTWGFGRGGVPRFNTILLLTQDAGAHIRFTHGLEMEARLDAYATKLSVAQPARQATGSWNWIPKAPDTVGSSVTSATEEPADDRRGDPVLVEQRLSEGGAQGEAHHAAHPPSGIRDSYCQPKWLSHAAPALPQASGPAPDPEGTSAVSPSPSDNDDDEWLSVQANRQLLDEALYRERRNAEIQFQANGDMSGYRALLPPSTDGARSLGPSGSVWRWSNEVRRWYWVDRFGRIWWHP